jgi:hypothetical protein
VESLREAGVNRDDFAKISRCRAQAASLMREERAAKRILDQEQKARRSVEAVVGGAPARPAIPSAPLPQPEPQAVPLPVQATARAAEPSAVAEPVPPAAPPHRPAATQAAPEPAAADATSPPPSPEAIAKAEAYVEENIVAAAQIRYDGGVTPLNTAFFRHLTLPSDLVMIDALVRGNSDVLAVLDQIGGEDLDTAAA